MDEAHLAPLYVKRLTELPMSIRQVFMVQKPFVNHREHLPTWFAILSDGFHFAEKFFS